jgi:uncharacterized membrane protein YGL010W
MLLRSLSFYAQFSIAERDFASTIHFIWFPYIYLSASMLIAKGRSFQIVCLGLHSSVFEKKTAFFCIS